MSTAASMNDALVFNRSNSAGRTGTLLMLGGLGLVGVAMLGFALAVFKQSGTLALHAMSTMPMIAAVGVLAAGRSLLKTPRRVMICGNGLTIETANDTRLVRWDEVGYSAVETGSLNHRRHLNITDLNGKSIAKLDQTFDRFDELAALIDHHVESRADDTAHRLLCKKARHQGILCFMLGLFMAFACGSVAWSTYENQREKRLLQEKGQPGQGEIVRRFIAPNGVTKRLEYRVVGVAGHPDPHNVEVEPAYWDSLEGVKPIPVIFVPDEPSISRLADGEREDRDLTQTAVGGYLLAALGGAMALFLLVMSPLMAAGWDLAFDSDTRKWSLKRYGKIVWSSRDPAEKRPPWMPTIS